MRSLLAVGIVLAALLPTPAQAERVSVREGMIRLTPSPFGVITDRVPYGAEIKVDQTQEAWVHIAQPSCGWMHVSSFSASQKSLMTSGGPGRSQAVSDNEVSLAGKGFDKNVEAAYLATHGSLRYDLIDQVERITVDEEAIKRFVDAGARRGQ